MPARCAAIVRTPPAAGAGGLATRATLHQCGRVATMRCSYSGHTYCTQHAAQRAVDPTPLVQA